MKKKKKLLSVFLSVIMVLGMFSGMMLHTHAEVCENHSDGNDEDSLCDVCGYDMSGIGEGGGADTECTEHTYENGYYFADDDYHYLWCDNCDYYDSNSAEKHYEASTNADHYCDGCSYYVRAFCTPINAETDHRCVNGENCGQRLSDLCTDADNNHNCDGCEEAMDWLCEDDDSDHLCDAASCQAEISNCYDHDVDGQCDTAERLLPL